jgi:3-isopropylmalate/(R)-2-methylmalate dehydratase small subunit
MELVISGKVIKMGDDVNTDVIIPAKYLMYMELKDLEKVAFHPLGEDFRNEMKNSNIIVAGRNFGCGSSREQGATAVKSMGIKAVVAKSFGRIFFRNAINSGLLVVEQREITESLTNGDEITIDVARSVITAKGKEYKFPDLPQAAAEILQAGGMFQYLKKQIESGKI